VMGTHMHDKTLGTGMRPPVFAELPERPGPEEDRHREGLRLRAVSLAIAVGVSWAVVAVLVHLFAS
jgi:hypothetical protein